MCDAFGYQAPLTVFTANYPSLPGAEGAPRSTRAFFRARHPGKGHPQTDARPAKRKCHQAVKAKQLQVCLPLIASWPAPVLLRPLTHARTRACLCA